MPVTTRRVAPVMTTGTWIALGAVLLALGFGGYRAMTGGRFRAKSGGRAVRPATAERVETAQPDSSWSTLAEVAGVAPGERATLVQFSSAFCAPCRTTRRVLSDVAGAVPGVVHVELDAEHHLEVVRRLKVLRTPTTLVLDADGNEVARASGAPRKEQVMGALP